MKTSDILPINEYGFVTQFSYPYPVSYSQFKIWRNRIPAASKCEIGRCGKSRNAAKYIYDHCHIHDVIRGELCQRHNLEMTGGNKVMTVWRCRWVTRCPYCVSTAKRSQSRLNRRDVIS